MKAERIRELKERDIDVYFEEQGIHTISPDGELMITILGAYAQEESRSVSENQKWRIQQNVDEYVEFMQKYMNSDGSDVVSMMGSYYSILARYFL